MSASQWSPAEVLQLNPNCLGFNCIGHAKTRGRGCRNGIAYANRQEGIRILQDLSRVNPQSQGVDAQLEDLASRLLCRRWHQDQADEIKAKWHCRIQNHQAAQTARPAERSSEAEGPTTPARTSVARTQVTSVRRETVVSSVTTSVNGESCSVAVVSITVQEETERRETNEPGDERTRQQTTSGSNSSSRQEVSSQETTTQQSNVPPQTSSPDEPTTAYHTATRQEVHQTPANEAEPSSPITSSPPQAHHPQHSASHLAPHHDRRAIEGDCPICCEDLSTGSGTTWCRAQCRQNFHADCMDLWHASQEADEREKTCPYCRTRWAR